MKATEAAAKNFVKNCVDCLHECGGNSLNRVSQEHRSVTFASREGGGLSCLVDALHFNTNVPMETSTHARCCVSCRHAREYETGNCRPPWSSSKTHLTAILERLGTAEDCGTVNKSGWNCLAKNQVPRFERWKVSYISLLPQRLVHMAVQTCYMMLSVICVVVQSLSNIATLEGAYDAVESFYAGCESLNASSIASSLLSHPVLFWTLCLLPVLLPQTDGCSTRPSPKPRPPRPYWVPNITTEKENCTEDYANLYCVNGGVCFQTKMMDSVAIACDCPMDYYGHRCQYADPSEHLIAEKLRQRVETASIAGGLAVLVIVLFAIGLALFVYQRRRRYPREVHDTADGLSLPDRPFSMRKRNQLAAHFDSQELQTQRHAPLAQAEDEILNGFERVRPTAAESRHSYVDEVASRRPPSTALHYGQEGTHVV